MLTAEEIGYMLGDSRAKGVVTTHDLYEAVEINRGLHEEFKHVLMVGNHPPSRCVDFWDLVKKSPENLDMPETRANGIAYICYTSGTTGFPKGVVQPQRTLIGRDPLLFTGRL